MRTIKFRGKTRDGEWVYGYYLPSIYEDVDIITVLEDFKLTEKNYHVLKETISQFTGLLDKNGKEIFEGDIIKMSTATYGDEIFRIGYEDSHIGAFCLCSDEQEDTSRFVSIFGGNYGYEPFYCEVIGNIHDNPELIKRETI